MTHGKSGIFGRADGGWRRLASIAALLSFGLSTSVFAADAPAKPAHYSKLVEKLAAGQVPTTPDDWVWIDMEHQPYSMVGLKKILMQMVKEKAPNGQWRQAPIVRIPMEGPHADQFGWMIKQVLDQGAMGIIIPHMETAEQVAKAVEAVRHPQMKNSKYPTPKGLRGHGGVPAPWGIPESEYIYRHGDVWPLNPEGDIVLFPMIESGEAVKNARAMIMTPGVSGLIIAPNDLSLSLGVGPTSAHSNGAGWPFHPDTEAAIESVRKVCAETKKICGFAATKGDVETKKRLDQGFNFIARLYLPGSQLSADD